MKYLYLISLLVSLTADAKSKSEAAARGLKGRVASVTETETANQIPINGCILRPAKTYTYTTHVTDDHGRQTICDYYNKDSVSIERKTRTYDEKGNETELLYEWRGSLHLWKIRYTYDENGWPIKTDQFSSPTKIDQTLRSDGKSLLFIRRTVYRYDRQGKMTDEDFYNEHDSLLSTKHFQQEQRQARRPGEKAYDSGGNMKMSVLYDKQGNPRNYAVYRYDAAGNEVSASYYPDSARTIAGWTVTKKYDKNNNLVLQESNDKRGTRVEYEYDAEGNKTQLKVAVLNGTIYKPSRRERYNKDGALMEMTSYADNEEVRVVHEYDARGNETGETTYDKDNSVESERFRRYADFDEAGNWRKAISWSDNDVYVYVTTRTITYWR